MRVLIRITGFHPLVPCKMALSVRDLLIELDPGNREQYEANFRFAF